MAQGQIVGRQIKDGTIGRDDINISVSGQAMIRKVLGANGVAISVYTGADSGTGDVTLTADLTYLDTQYPSLITSRAQGLFLASPAVGSGAATFRAITASDIPSLAGTYIQNQNSVSQTANWRISGIGSALTSLGAGIVTPASMIHSYESNTAASAANGVTIEQAGIGDATMHFLLSGGQRYTMGIDNSDGDKFKIGTSADLNSSNLVTLTSAGLFGIGNTSPAEALDVTGKARVSTAPTNSTDVVRLVDIGGSISTTGYINNQNSSAQSASYWIAGSGIIGGTLGIGTATFTSHKLEVNGYLKITSTGLQGIKLGAYGTLTEGAGGQATILGNNVIAGSGTNTIRKYSTSDPGSFIKMHYVDGITFNVNIGGTVGTDVADTTGEAMRISHSTRNVSIGTTTNTARLSVQDDTDGSATIFQLKTSDSGLSTGQELRTDYQQNSNILARQAFTYFNPDYGFNFYGYNAGSLNSTPIVTMRGSGNVGIGIASPNQLLHLQTSTANQGMLIRNTSTGGSNSTPVFLASDAGATLSNVNIEHVGLGNFAVRTGATTETGYGTIRFVIGASGAVGLGGTISSPSTLVGSNLFISSSGNVGIGTTTPSYKLQTVGVGLFNEDTNHNAVMVSAGTTGVIKSAWTQYGYFNTPNYTTIWETGMSYDKTTDRNWFVSYTGSGSRDTTKSLIFTTTGNLGIGTSSPSYKLDIHATDTIYNTRFYQPSSATTSYNVNLISGAMTSVIGYFGVGGSTTSNTSFRDTFVIGTQTSHSLSFNTGDSTKMIILSSGNVGIGTITPLTALDINTGVFTQRESTLTYHQIATTSSGFNFNLNVGTANVVRDFIWNAAINGSASLERMRLTGAGNLGIGTSTPNAPLHVVGGAAVQARTIVADFTIGATGRSGSIILRSAYDTTSSLDAWRITPFGAGSGVTNNGNYLGFQSMATEVSGVASTWNTNVIITQAGNVAIGTTDAAQRLTVTNARGNPATTGSTQGGIFRLTPNDGGSGAFDFGISGAGVAWIQNSERTALGTSYAMAIQPNGGTVQIGYSIGSSMVEKFNVNGAIVSTGSRVDHAASQGTLAHSAGTTQLWSHGSNTSTLGAFAFVQRSSNGSVSNNAAIAITSASNVTLSPVTGGNRYLTLDVTSTGTGAFVLQAGAGSTGYGGSVMMFSHTHATRPGYITAGISSGSGGRFTVNSGGLSDGNDLFHVLSNGNTGVGSNFTPTAHFEIRGASQLVSAITDAGVHTGTIRISSTSGAGGSGGILEFSALNDNLTYVPQWAIKSFLNNGGGNGVGDLVFSARAVTTDVALTERIRITTGGIIIAQNLSASTVVVSDASKGLISSSITSTELGYLTGVTSNIQTQISSVTTNYALKDGSNATAASNWNINSATVTNGVYTTGSYSNPTWITSLAWSKITGTPTTIAGYGITDFNSLGDARWASIAGSASNLALGTRTATTMPITNSNGTGVTLPIATILLAGLMSDADKTKLDGIASGATANTGTVTSVAMSVPTGLSIAGTPITTTGTLALTFTAGYAIPTTAKQTEWDTAYTERRQWDGGSTNLNAISGRTALGGTTVGQNVFTITNPSAITFFRVNADNSVSLLDAATFRTAIGAGTSSATGTVTSVAMSVPTGLSISGSPITTSGTLAVTLTAGYSIPTTSSQTNWDTAYTQTRQWDGGTTGLVAATGRTSLGGTTVGQNIFTLTNPSAISFIRINADNTVDALSASAFRTAIGASSGTVTSVTSANADIGIANTTTTPVLTLNTGMTNGKVVVRSADNRIDFTTAGTDYIEGGLTTLTLRSGTTFFNSGTTNKMYVNSSGVTVASGSLSTSTTSDVFLQIIATGGTAPTMSGTPQMVIVDSAGKLSRQTIPSSGGSGTVTSVALSVPTGLTITSGSPITTSGTITVGLQSGYSIPSTTDQSSWTGKQAALSGTGFVKISGTTISYDNSTYLTTSSAASTYLTTSTAASTYLPLAGGTLTGNLAGTNVGLSGYLTVGSTIGAGGSISGVGFYDLSDIRKKNIVNNRYNSDKIQAVSYSWKNSENDDIMVGYIAQEVQECMPYAVKLNGKGDLTVSYNQVFANKIQRLEDRVKELEKMLNI